MNHALKPLEPPYSEDVAATLSTYPRGEDGYLIQLFRVFANSPRFLKKGVANLLDKESPLSLREREIVILRTTANLDCEYEWGIHVATFARAARLDEACIRSSRLGGSADPCWSEEEALLVECVDQLCETGTISEDRRARFEVTWDLDQQLEILALCGNYHTVSFVANVSRLPSEDMGALFPK